MVLIWAVESDDSTLGAATISYGGWPPQDVCTVKALKRECTDIDASPPCGCQANVTQINRNLVSAGPSELDGFASARRTTPLDSYAAVPIEQLSSSRVCSGVIGHKDTFNGDGRFARILNIWTLAIYAHLVLRRDR